MSATATAVRPKAAQDGRKAFTQVPEAFRPLYSPARYKIAFGGRGAGKSHAVATYILSRAVNKTVRILRAREVQASLRDSVHKLLCDQITALRINSHFDITQSSIRTKNGSEIVFEGLKYNVSRIKSLEGCDICWVEEAQTVSHASWEVLIPTIRKEGSEIIVTMNPELATDASYVRFIADPPPGAVLMPCSFADNRFFPQVLADEMELLRQRDPDAYAHVWLGNCRQFLAGAIYANELRAAEAEGRIGDVPYDPSSPVSCYFDLGWADCTSIWIVQHISNEARFIDFIQDQQRTIGHYLHILRTRGYDVQTIWLPHDSRKTDLGTGRSVQELVRADGWHVRITPNLLVPDGINALRTIFPKIWIDQRRCADGLQSLRHYKFEVDPNTGQFGRTPLHDHASHACLTADAEVWTERGHVPIADVVVGDRVWTPRGFADVTHAGPVKQVSKLLQVELTDGRSICCTPEHKILTNRGFVRADALRYSDRVFRGDEWPIRLIALYSKVRSIGFRDAITGATNGANLGRQTFIGRFGRAAEGLFRKALRCITRTAIHSTTRLAIWPSFAEVSTSGSTHSSESAGAKYTHPARWRVGELLNGMQALKAGPGIASTRGGSGITPNGTTASVSSVVSRFVRLILRRPSGAIRVARLRTYDSAEGSQWVYDLTCRNHACYQANGVLVSNSDAARYCAAAMQEQRRAGYHVRPKPPPVPVSGRGNYSWLGR